MIEEDIASLLQLPGVCARIGIGSGELDGLTSDLDLCIPLIHYDLDLQRG